MIDLIGIILLSPPFGLSSTTASGGRVIDLLWSRDVAPSLYWNRSTDLGLYWNRSTSIALGWDRATSLALGWSRQVSFSLTWSDSMAIPGQFSFFRGEALTLTFTAATATSILGWTLVFTVKKNQNDASATLSITPTITDSTNGIMTVGLTKAQTLALIYQSYQWDLQRTDSGSEAVLAIGTMAPKHQIRQTESN